MFGDNTLTIEELEELFNDDVEQETPPAEENTDPQTEVQTETGEATEQKPNNVEQTKAFAKRLRESTDKARSEEREAIAKSLGYDSYAAMMSQRESQQIKDKGFDPDEVSPLVNELVKQRIDADPRMKELEDLRKRNLADFAKREMAQITQLTGGRITRLDQLPKEVIDSWKQKGSLKSAFLEVEGENLINTIRSEQSKGTTNHMATPNASTQAPSNKRALNDEEKRMWRLFNPGISEEELNRKTVNK